MSIKLETYLLNRELNAPNKDVGAEILADDQLLAEIAGIWRGHRKAIETLLQARIQPIREELVLKAYPAEVVVLRQAIVEIGALATDLETYAAEHERRTKAKEGQEPTDEGDNPSSTD